MPHSEARATWSQWLTYHGCPSAKVGTESLRILRQMGINPRRKMTDEQFRQLFYRITGFSVRK